MKSRVTAFAARAPSDASCSRTLVRASAATAANYVGVKTRCMVQ
jgi:hypothetical protein